MGFIKVICCILGSISLVFFTSALCLSKTSVDLRVSPVKNHFSYPEGVAFQACLSGPNPINGAEVTAFITSPAGKRSTVELSGNLLLGNTIPNRGCYAAIFTGIQEDGVYRIIVKAHDRQGKATFIFPFDEERPPSPQTKNGPPPSPAVAPFSLESSFTVTTSGYARRGGLPPLRILDLYAEIKSDGCVQLSWSIPSNIGLTGLYEIRSSQKSITSEGDWSAAQVMEKGKYSLSKEKEARSKTRLCHLNRGIYFIAIRSINAKGEKSEISNDYIVKIQ
jgi:hypothetical protein